MMGASSGCRAMACIARIAAWVWPSAGNSTPTPMARAAAIAVTR